NVLLSFAQFERELIGERVRDKIAASKRKGIWVGGPVPLGYAAVDKKIVVVPAEAEAVRTIFAQYIELGSVRALAQDLDRRGIRMSPTHANKGGLRYRYYVSQAVLQRKPQPSGLVSRVPAAEIEVLVVVALRNHLNASGVGPLLLDNDHELLERHLERVTLTA